MQGYNYRAPAEHGCRTDLRSSSELGPLCFSAALFCSAFLLVPDSFRKCLAAGLTVPLLIRLRLDLTFDQELREFSTLRFAFKGHLAYWPVRSGDVVCEAMSSSYSRLEGCGRSPFH